MVRVVIRVMCQKETILSFIIVANITMAISYVLTIHMHLPT
jgi:hypothetical protein